MSRARTWSSLFTALAVLVAVAPVRAQDPVWDLWIRGATVYDGTGSKGRVADVAVDDGRIVFVGGNAPDVAATETVDANGLALAPGFVDVHAHADVDARNRPLARNLVSMGVTTIITGNCGSSVTDLDDHFARIEKKGISLNYGSLVGHGTVRTQAMGRARRAPTPDELAKMQGLVDRAMGAGAFGLSTGLIYVPGTYAETAELVALTKVVARHDGIYASHMRDEGARVIEAIREALTIGEQAGVPIHLSHLKASGKPNWGKSAAIAELLTQARAAGRRVTGDQYAYTASSTSLDVLFPAAALSIGRKQFGAKLEGDPAFRDEMTAALYRTMDVQGFTDLRYCQIASARGNRQLQGLRISEAAERKFGSDSRENQARMAIDLMVAAQGARIGMVYHKMAEDDVERIMKLPFVSVACDAGIRDFSRTAERPHPRGAGNNPRVLGRYVRDRKVIPLELAIHKMTQLPTRVFGIAERGAIRTGCFADLVLFDPDTVSDGATYEEPLLPPRGLPHVIVNGQFVIRNGEHTKATPGRVLRFRGQPDREDR